MGPGTQRQTKMSPQGAHPRTSTHASVPFRHLMEPRGCQSLHIFPQSAVEDYLFYSSLKASQLDFLEYFWGPPVHIVFAFPEEPHGRGELTNGANAVVKCLGGKSLGTGFGPSAGSWAASLVPPFVGKSRDLCLVLEGPFHSLTEADFSGYSNHRSY